MGKPAPNTRNARARFIAFIIHHPRAVILCVALLTVLFSSGFLRGLPLEVSPAGFSEKASREWEDLCQARRNFGDDLYLVIGLVSQDVFAPANLTPLRSLHERLEALAGGAG